MDIRPIRTTLDHMVALTEIERLRDAPDGSAQANQLEVLALLVEHYETRHHTFPRANPLEILRYAIDEMGRTQSDLATLIGSRSRASELLAGKRRLTRANVHAISSAWNIPADVLVGPYEIETAA